MQQQHCLLCLQKLTMAMLFLKLFWALSLFLRIRGVFVRYGSVFYSMDSDTVFSRRSDPDLAFKIWSDLVFSWWSYDWCREDLLEAPAEEGELAFNNTKNEFRYCIQNNKKKHHLGKSEKTHIKSAKIIPAEILLPAVIFCEHPGPHALTFPL